MKVSCVIVGDVEEDLLDALGIHFAPPASIPDGGSDVISFGRFNKTAGVRGVWRAWSCIGGTEMSRPRVVCLDIR